MSFAPRVSVVVVSHHRPEALSLCLRGIAQLDYAPLEVIVVADRAGLDVVRGSGLGDHIKTVQVDAAGISAARNAGLACAAGDVVAFIDDDAVPEPTWLTHLVAPFADLCVAAAGGYVIGRNGISLQWRARTFDQTGAHSALSVADEPSLHQGTPDRGIKTEGTNMAFRRDALLALGGFDPAYRFYLDETDVNMRLAKQGAVTAIVPLARVHHGFAPSERRKADRAPRSLRDVGASSAIFLRRHCDGDRHEAALADLRRGQRVALEQHMVDGRIDPRDVGRLMATLEDGITEGQARALPDIAPLHDAKPEFLAFPTRTGRKHHLIAGRVWRANSMAAQARAVVVAGDNATVMRFSHTALYHRMRFHPDGYWVQTGGLYGRSDRSDPVFKLHTFWARVRQEMHRMAKVRPLVRLDRASNARNVGD